VGLNELAADSNGVLYGRAFKPKFDALYAKVQALRANRQRQGLKENSPKLDHLETKLSGMIKTGTGEVANKLVAKYPGHVFALEDLDLRGCKGSKRFAYRALHHTLGKIALCLYGHPAYTSQPCPSCRYVSRLNRRGIKFECRSCGRKAHADYVGAQGILRRSYDPLIDVEDHYTFIGALEAQRYQLRRNKRSWDSCPLRLVITELAASSRELTTRGSLQRDTRIALNAAPVTAS
jgi:hypothetical protein